MLTPDVDWLLGEFARWSRLSDSPRLSYPSQTPFRRLLGSTVAGAGISDDTAIGVERALRHLAYLHPDWHDMLVLYYGLDRSRLPRKSASWFTDRGYGDFRTVTKTLEVSRAVIEGLMAAELKKTIGHPLPLSNSAR